MSVNYHHYTQGKLWQATSLKSSLDPGELAAVLNCCGQGKETDIISICHVWRQFLLYSVQELYLGSGEWVFLSDQTQAS